MECRQALKIRDLVLARLAGSQALEGDMAFLSAHLASCEACRADAAGIESVWSRLGDDDGAAVHLQERQRRSRERGRVDAA